MNQKGRGNRKYILENNGYNFSKFYKNFTSIDPRTLMSINQQKYEEKYIQTHHNQSTKNQ